MWEMGMMGKTAHVGKIQKKLVLGLAALVVAGSLSACDDARAGADAAAKQLASSLAALDVGQFAVDGKDVRPPTINSRRCSKVWTKPSVTSGDVKLDGDTATFPLKYTWTIGSAAWEYSSQASLKKTGGKWAVQWNPAMLAPQLAEGETLSVTMVPAQRGQILGAGDAPIVQDRPVFRVGTPGNGGGLESSVDAVPSTAPVMVSRSVVVRHDRPANPRVEPGE